MVAGGGGKSSIGTSSLGGDGGDLSNSAMGASSGIGDTELLSIADNFMGDTLVFFCTSSHLRWAGGETHTKVMRSPPERLNFRNFTDSTRFYLIQFTAMSTLSRIASKTEAYKFDNKVSPAIVVNLRSWKQINIYLLFLVLNAVLLVKMNFDVVDRRNIKNLKKC